MEEEQVSVVKSMRSCSVVLVPTFCVAAAALHTSVHLTACSRRTRLIACNEPDGPTALFTALCAQHSPMAAVALTGSAQNGGGRRPVTTRSVQAGEIILTVPPELLLTSHRSGVIAGLQGQTELMWEAAGDLRQEVGEELFKRGATWDVRLALAVFEATAGSASEFWSDYRRLMPPPPLLTHPLCLPDELRPEMQNPELQAKTAAKAALLEALHPMLHPHATHPVTASYERMGSVPMEYIPRPLPYSYALVVSRCFAMSDGDTFAFVPFLDFCQCSFTPSANFNVSSEGVTLRALTPLAKGDEVTISYDPEYTSEQLYAQYAV